MILSDILLGSCFSSGCNIDISYMLFLKPSVFANIKNGLHWCFEREGDRIQTVSTDTNQRTWVPQSKCVTGIRIQRFDTTDTIQISIWILITLHGSGDTIQMVWILSLVTCSGLCSCWHTSFALYRSAQQFSLLCWSQLTKNQVFLSCLSHYWASLNEKVVSDKSATNPSWISLK